MIDLTQKELPNVIYDVNGNSFCLNTDFRIWIRFNNEYNNAKKDERLELDYLFNGKAPAEIDKYMEQQLLFFLYNPSVTPSVDSQGTSNEKILDYLLDGDYIFSALYQTYGIDIMEMDMHWHKFKALCDNVIGESTLWGYAKSIRGYKKASSKDTIEKVYLKQKEAWSFKEYEESATYEEFDDYFSDVKEVGE